MRKELKKLQKYMTEFEIDMYLIPTTDYHGSEYISDFFKGQQFISGFTGSAATLVVTQEDASLWTDGRYFIQAEKQLKGTGIDLMKIGEEGVPTVLEYIESNLFPYSCLAFDSRLVSIDMAMELTKMCEDELSIIDSCSNIIDLVWKTRPDFFASPEIHRLDISVTGESCDDKICKVRQVMKIEGGDSLLISSLEEIGWLFNLRGKDIACTPVFYGFCLITADNVYLYTCYPSLVADLVPSYVTNVFYDLVYSHISSLPLGKTMITDTAKTNFKFYDHLRPDTTIISEPSPIEMLKAIKNPAEISATIKAHQLDGIAMVKFLYWLKDTVGKEQITEISASDYLYRCRAKQLEFMDLSFPTICGYNSNGAIVHYSATEESDSQISAEGFLLVDSGGQYCCGTTDITRTIALGSLTQQMKEYYTAVLSANLSLAMAKFPLGTKGKELDKIARQPLLDIGLNFNHGTGHGVGHMLSVHEGPNVISPKGDCPIVQGMITSDEPGVYIEGQFGIRLENEILCQSVNRDPKDQLLEFQILTLCPFDRDAILPNSLSAEQLDYLNKYHSYVYTTLSPFLTDDESDWLKRQTAPL